MHTLQTHIYVQSAILHFDIAIFQVSSKFHNVAKIKLAVLCSMAQHLHNT